MYLYNMFYYLIHQIMQMKFMDDKENGKKNVMTFLFGSILYFLLYGYLRSPTTNINNFVMYALKNFFHWFILIDMICMAVIYKLYYNRSIFNEMSETVFDKNVENVENVENEKSD